MKIFLLDEAFDFIRNGASIKQGDNQGGYPITRIETIANGYIDLSRLGYANISDLDKYQDYVMKQGDILMSHINSEKHLGKVAIYQDISEIIIHGMNLLCLRANKNLLFPKYAYYYFQTMDFKLQIPKITKKSVNQASFSVTDLKKLKIVIPTLEVQMKIVSILDQAQELIDKRKAQIQNLDELIQSVFYDMFGDPRESINNNSINNKVRLLGDITNLIAYGLTVRPNYTEVGIPLISAREIKSGKIDFSIAPFISTNDFDKLSDKAKARKNEILFSKTGSIGNCAIVETDFDFAVTQNAARISLIPSIVNTKWLLYYLRTNYIQILCNRLAKGNTVKDLQIQDIKKIPIFLPDIQLQNQFAEIVEKIEKQKELLNESLVELENNFNSLMQRAFNVGPLS